MQITPRYLVNNRVSIIANEAGLVTEYRPVYQRQIQVYRGIDNVLQFKLLNSDQKPINTNRYTPVFIAFDENKNKILERDCTVLDDGSTAQRGLFTVTITEGDLLNLDQQYLNYNVYLLDENNVPVLTYTDSHFGNNGTIYLSSEAFPAIKDSMLIETFTEVDLTEDLENFWISEVSVLSPEQNNNTAVHTAAVYSTEYVGTVTVQVTLESQVTGTTSWADIATLDLDNETEPTPVNFNGIFNYVRFKADSDPTDKITKILIRN